MKPLRLLAIIEAYSITGPAKNLLEFAGRAAAQNVSTTIATFTRGESENQFTRAVQRAGLGLEIIPERGPFDPAQLRSLREIAVRAQPDVIQTHAVKSHFLVRSAGLPAVVPWVAFHHGYTWPTVKARAYNQLDRWSLRAAKRIVTVSAPFRDQLVAFGVQPERIDILHNAIPPDWGAKFREPEAVSKLRASAKISPERRVILIVGRLSREKDHLTLLDAMIRLPSAIQPHLVIVGEGPEKPRIEERMRQLRLTDSVTFTGQQASAEPWYGIADLAVLSSLSEGSPNALLEAMATGVPVVATAVGGVPEIVSNEESALLIEPGNAQTMSTAMARLLTDPELAACLTARSRELILERHDPDSRVQKLVSIYRSITARQVC
jgi:glycosyltransferase involved in cell wall biosynthesis